MLGTWAFVIGLVVFGFLLLMLELFVIPGFGIAGIAGIVAILGAVIFASFALGIWVAIAIFAVAFFASLVAVVKATTGGPLAKLANRSISPGKVYDEQAPDRHLPSIGARGVAITPLRPAGIVQIDGLRYDVIVDGPVIEPGEAVEVVEVMGNVIKVRPV